MRSKLLIRAVLPALLALALAGCKKTKPSDSPEHTAEPRRAYSDAYASGVASTPPIEICMHLAGLAAAEAGVVEPQFDPQLIADCERELTLEAAVRGSENWNAMAACVLEARNGPDLDDCNRAHPLPDPNAQGLPGEGSRERAACEHLVELVLLETAAEQGEVPVIASEERRGLVDECVAVLVDEQGPTLSPAEYDALLTCLLDASSSEQIQAC